MAVVGSGELAFQFTDKLSSSKYGPDEYPRPGGGLTGVFSAAESHLKQPHDDEQDIYDNECPEAEQEDYEDMGLIPPQQDQGEEIYEDTAPSQQLQDTADELYEDSGPPQQLDDTAEIYDDMGPPQQLEDTEAQVYEAPVNESQNAGEEIYEAPEAENTEEQIYDNEGPEVAKQQPAKPSPPPEPPSDYREVAADASQQQLLEPMPGKAQQQQQQTLLQMSAEQGSLTSEGDWENPCIRCYNCTHAHEFADLTSSEKV